MVAVLGVLKISDVEAKLELGEGVEDTIDEETGLRLRFSSAVAGLPLWVCGLSGDLLRGASVWSVQFTLDKAALKVLYDEAGKDVPEKLGVLVALRNATLLLEFDSIKKLFPDEYKVVTYPPE